jgi:preprotein translocase subunit SecD
MQPCNQTGQPLAGIFVSGERYMTRNPYFRLVLILILVAVSAWIDLSKTISIPGTPLQRNVDFQLGLDLRGGLQALLEVPEGVTVTAADLDNTRAILENRVNGLGVSEVVMQSAPPRRIVAEFPGVTNPEQVIAAMKQTGLLEFVDLGAAPLPEGTIIETDYRSAGTTQAGSATATSAAAATATPGGAAANPAATATAAPIVYHTVMTGAGLDNMGVQAAGAGGYAISFSLKPDASAVFADYTTKNVGKYLAIVLDKKILSAPVIKTAITTGTGQIEGNFTQASANVLANNLRYGSLPVPVSVVESQTVGATLGAESMQKSLLAGIIGLSVVILFMLLYYRLPGLVADLALITYALISMAIFKFGIPGIFSGVTLTLPGIAGFILSIGMAVDANILIFERMKEELRSGRPLEQAIDLGWRRAWPSIRDSNSSTLITCVILYMFGNAFGASMVKGFSVTLALGVVVSLFTAITVTRTYLHVLLDSLKAGEHPRWFGL